MTMKNAAFTRNSARHEFNSGGEMAARSGSFGGQRGHAHELTCSTTALQTKIVRKLSRTTRSSLKEALIDRASVHSRPPRPPTKIRAALSPAAHIVAAPRG